MANNQIVSTLNIMSQIIKAQDLLEDTQCKIKQIIQSTPAIFPLAGNVCIDIETALEAMQDVETAVHLMIDGLKVGGS